MTYFILTLLVISALCIGLAILWPSITGDRLQIERERTAQRSFDYKIEQEKTVQQRIWNERVLNWSLAILPYFGITVGLIVLGGFAYMMLNKQPAPQPVERVPVERQLPPPVINVFISQGQRQPSRREKIRLLLEAGVHPENLEAAIDGEWREM